jgi:hypothetical protein
MAIIDTDADLCVEVVFATFSSKCALARFPELAYNGPFSGKNNSRGAR